jgi:hypothetical protein
MVFSKLNNHILLNGLYMKMMMKDCQDLGAMIRSIFGYFAIAWFSLLSVGIMIGSYMPKSFNFALTFGQIYCTVFLYKIGA